MIHNQKEIKVTTHATKYLLMFTIEDGTCKYVNVGAGVNINTGTILSCFN